MSQHDNRRDPEWPPLAAVTVVLLCISGVVAADWVFGWHSVDGVDTSEMVQRSRAVAPFGALVLAIITFCTVIWRGTLQQRQVEAQEAQNSAKDAADYAALMLDGAKLLGEKGKLHNQVAGVAALSQVISDPEKRFSVQAMNILALEWLQNYPDYETNSYLEAVRQALVNGRTKYMVSSEILAEFRHNRLPRSIADEEERLRRLQLGDPDFDSVGRKLNELEQRKMSFEEWPSWKTWEPVCGFKKQVYRGGNISNILTLNEVLVDGPMLFNNVKFTKIDFGDIIFNKIGAKSNIAVNCVFEKCDFEIFAKGLADKNNTFLFCDFRNAAFHDFREGVRLYRPAFKRCKFPPPPFEFEFEEPTPS